MALLTPLKLGDYTDRARCVTTPLAPPEHAGARDLVCRAIFGSRELEDSPDRTVQQYHMRGYIDIQATPVLNPILAGHDGDLLGKILGLSAADTRAIAKYEVVMDGDELVPVQDMPEQVDFESILIGAQIFEYYINNIKLEAELKNAMAGFVMEFFKAAGYKVTGVPGAFTKAHTHMPVIGEWYFNPTVQVNGDDYMRWYAANSNTSTSRMEYLCRLSSLPDGIDRLRGCIMKRIMVTPIGSRPSSDNRRHDNLTTAYAEVMKQHQQLAIQTSGYQSLDMAVQQYKLFDRYVRALLVEHDIYSPNSKAVLERLKGKSGFIRDKMLGKRIDHSGRSVITIDPFMSIRDIGIPKDMIPKLYRSATLRTMDKPQLDKYVGTKRENVKRSMKRIEQEGLLDKINVITGRQPTLHKPSMRSFHPVPVDGRSIQLNPLSVIGFNADFDGDQMYVRVPTTKEGILESNELMSAEQNMFLPKNGDCLVMPRQEIIYGLSVCTREGDYHPGHGGGHYGNINQLIYAIKTQEVEITSPVSCGGYSGTAGRVAFMNCINRDAFTSEELANIMKIEVTSSSIKDIVNKMVRFDPHAAIDYIDSMVRLGFVVSGTYPPRLSLYDVNIDYSGLMHNFHKAIDEDTQLYNMGWETESEYNDRYTSAFDQEVDSKVKGKVGEEYGAAVSAIENDIGLDNGFVRMSRSGARGSKSNLLQLYGYKGRVQNGATGGAFRAVIEHSYVQQLTPLEHFMTAYGSRASLIQKSLNTADSGYAMRKIWHTTSPFIITNDDCGSTEGVVIAIGDLVKEFSCDAKSARAIFVDMVAGRYLAKPYKGCDTNTLITRSIAKEWAEDKSCAVEIRSVLTCKNPCCKKCYGTDLSTNSLAALGLPVGFIAAQSIGEPGTQLNMDAFKKGGIAAETTTVRLSGFTKLATYIDCSPLTREDPSYDPVAWGTGTVNVKAKTDGTQAVSIEGYKRTITLPINVPLKPYVEKGEGLRMVVGDKNVSEVLANSGLLAAQRYLCYALYSVYKDEGAVNLKHFEVLALAMTMWKVITTKSDKLVPGQWHDAIMMHNHADSTTTSIVGIQPVRSVQGLRPYALSRIAMERVHSGLSSSVLLGLEDPLTYPFNRVLMGMTPWEHRAYEYDGESNMFIKQRRI